MGCNKKKSKKALFTLLAASLLFSQTVFAEELANDVQKVNVKNSYLTGVVVDNKSAEMQQVEVSKSFLVFVKVKVYPASNVEAK